MNTKGMSKKYVVLYKEIDIEQSIGASLFTKDFTNRKELEKFVDENAETHDIRIILGWEFKVQTRYEIARGSEDELEE